MTDPETLGELARRFDRFEASINLNMRDERATREQQLAMVVKEHVYLAHRSADQADVAGLDKALQAVEQRGIQRHERIEERLTWAWRAAITGVLLPLVMMIVYALLQQGTP